MSKTLVIFGATGNQGGSIVRLVVNDAELSKTYKVRAVTRNPSSEAAQALVSQGIEVVAGDGDDKTLLARVMKGADFVFALSVSNYVGEGGHSEYDQGKNMVDAAVTAGVEYFIWSTLPSPTKLSNGKYRQVSSFEAKAQVEDYLRTQPIKSAFYAPGSFMQNFLGMTRPRPAHSNDGTYIIAGPVSSSTSLPLVDIAGDTGKFVAAILADPVGFEGKTICGATKLYTMDEQAQMLSNATGKTVNYVELAAQQYRSFMPPAVQDQLTEMRQYQAEFGYYGPETETLVKWSVKQARGTPSTFEDFLAKNPLILE